MIAWFKKDTSENVLVLHIDSGSVGVALMHRAKGLPSEIVYKTRVLFSAPVDSTEQPLEDSMIKALSKALLRVLNNAPAILKKRGLETKVKRALVTLSSPWIVSSLNTLNIDQEKSFTLDSKLILEAIRREEEALRQKTSPQYNSKNDFFESTFVKLRVNGYKATLPALEKTKNAQIDFITNASSKELIRSIENEILKSFSVERGIFLQGFMFAYFKVLSQVFHHLHSSLLINVSNESTEMLFVEHDNLKLLTSLPLGPVPGAQWIKDKLNLPLPIAESYLELFSSGDFSPQTMIMLEPIINSMKQEWRDSWKKKTEKFPRLNNSLYAVFLTSLPKHHNVSKLFLESVLPNKNVVILGEDNKFTSEITKSPAGEAVDENLAIACFYDTI